MHLLQLIVKSLSFPVFSSYLLALSPTPQAAKSEMRVIMSSDLCHIQIGVVLQGILELKRFVWGYNFFLFIEEIQIFTQ